MGLCDLDRIKVLVSSLAYSQLYGAEILPRNFNELAPSIRAFYRRILSLPPCFPSHPLECLIRAPPIGSILLRRRLGFAWRVYHTNSVHVRDAAWFDAFVFKRGFFFFLSKSLKKIGLSHTFGDFASISFAKTEAIPRFEAFSYAELASIIPSYVSLSHLYRWHFDPFSFDWKAVYGLIRDISKPGVNEFLSVLFGSFRTTVAENYVHHCPFCLDCYGVDLFFSLEHALLDCEGFEDLNFDRFFYFMSFVELLDSPSELFLKCVETYSILKRPFAIASV